MLAQSLIESHYSLHGHTVTSAAHHWDLPETQQRGQNEPGERSEASRQVEASYTRLPEVTSMTQPIVESPPIALPSSDYTMSPMVIIKNFIVC